MIVLCPICGNEVEVHENIIKLCGSNFLFSCEKCLEDSMEENLEKFKKCEIRFSVNIEDRNEFFNFIISKGIDLGFKVEDYMKCDNFYRYEGNVYTCSLYTVKEHGGRLPIIPYKGKIPNRIRFV